MTSTVVKKAGKIIHAAAKTKFLEKIFQLVVNGKYLDSPLRRFIPSHDSYPNPTYRIVKRKGLTLHANLHDYNDWKAYWGFKETERENLYELVKTAEVVIDAGTNNGWLLINIAALIARNNGFVYGFEPHPDTYSRCMKNISASNIKNCKVFNMGCGDMESELSMQTVLESNSGQNRIVNNEQNFDDSSVTVRVCVLDNQLSNLKKIDLIKIDVEGFELHVLKGSDTLLKKHKPVLFIEIDDLLLKENKTSPAEIIQFLKNQYGYVIKNASDLNLVDEKADFHNCHMDIICFPPDVKNYADDPDSYRDATQQKMP